MSQLACCKSTRAYRDFGTVCFHPFTSRTIPSPRPSPVWASSVRRLLAKQVVAWVFTLINSALISAAVFALGVFSPSLTMAKDLAVYESRIRAASESLYGKLNASNYALSAAFSDKPFDATLNATIKSRMDKFKAMYNTKVIGYIDPYVSGAGRGRDWPQQL